MVTVAGDCYDHSLIEDNPPANVATKKSRDKRSIRMPGLALEQYEESVGCPTT